MPFRGFEEISDRLLRDIELVEIEIPGGTMTRDRKQFTPIQEAYYQASQYLERDDLPRALEAYKKVIELRPEPPFLSAIYTMMGMLHARARNQEAAVKAFREALELNKNLAYAHLFLGTAFMLSNRFEEAIGPIEKALELDPSLTHVNFYLGHVYGKLEQWDKAIAAYSAEIETHGQSSEAYHELSWLLVRLGDENEVERKSYYLRAIETLKKWTVVSPEEMETHDLIGYLYLKLGEQNPEAVEACERAVKMGPEDVRALFNLGTIYLGAERNEEAKAIFERLVRLGESVMREQLEGIAPNVSVTVRLSMGEAYQKLGVASLRMYLSYLASGSGDRSLLKEAERSFKTALTYFAEDTHSLYNLSITHWVMGYRVAAIKGFQAVLENDANNEDAANNLRLVEEELAKVRHWLGSKVWKRLENSTDQTPIYSGDLVDEIAEARAKIYENIDTLRESDAFASDDLLQALRPLIEYIPSAETVADLIVRIFRRGWLSSTQAAQLAGTDLAPFLAYSYLSGVSLEELANEVGDQDEKYRVALIEALKEVLELQPNDERARRQLQTLLQEQLDQKLRESGLLKEVRSPITDLTPYKNRTLMPVGSKPLSEIVVEDRR